MLPSGESLPSWRTHCPAERTVPSSRGPGRAVRPPGPRSARPPAARPRSVQEHLGLPLCPPRGTPPQIPDPAGKLWALPVHLPLGFIPGSCARGRQGAPRGSRLQRVLSLRGSHPDDPPRLLGLPHLAPGTAGAQLCVCCPGTRAAGCLWNSRFGAFWAQDGRPLGTCQVDLQVTLRTEQTTPA